MNEEVDPKDVPETSGKVYIIQDLNGRVFEDLFSVRINDGDKICYVDNDALC
jgi:hypothetical protein